MQNEIPHGQIVSVECREAVVATAFEILETVGITTNRREVYERLEGDKGLAVRDGRICVSRELARNVIALAAKNDFAVAARRPASPVIEVSPRATLTADHRQRTLRPFTRADAIEGTKLIQALAKHGVNPGTCGVPQDTSPLLQSIEQYLIGYRYGGNRTWQYVPAFPETRKAMEEIRDIAEDGSARSCAPDVWIISPLRLEGNELDEILDSRRPVDAFTVGAMPLMGLTGPADPLAVFTLALAETLGSAAILHRLFPEAKPSFCPHPQAIDLRSGCIAFGTAEWNRLELIRKEIFDHLGIGWYMKTNITSACMPDIQAQADKMASVALGVERGFRYFTIYPLCADEVWSPVQCLLDVEYVNVAWHTLRPATDLQPIRQTLDIVQTAIREALQPGEAEESIAALRTTYRPGALTRVFSSGQFNQVGAPDPIASAEEQVRELIRKNEHVPDGDKFGRMVHVYEALCRQVGGKSMNLD